MCDKPSQEDHKVAEEPEEGSREVLRPLQSLSWTNRSQLYKSVSSASSSSEPAPASRWRQDGLETFISLISESGGRSLALMKIFSLPALVIYEVPF